LAPQDMTALQNGSSPFSPNSSFGRPGESFNGPVGGIGPASGIGGSGVPGPAPGIGVVTPPTASEGVTEPQNWALLVTGFAVTGVLLRNRRLKTA